MKVCPGSMHNRRPKLHNKRQKKEMMIREKDLKDQKLITMC